MISSSCPSSISDLVHVLLFYLRTRDIAFHGENSFVRPYGIVFDMPGDPGVYFGTHLCGFKIGNDSHLGYYGSGEISKDKRKLTLTIRVIPEGTETITAMVELSSPYFGGAAEALASSGVFDGSIYTQQTIPNINSNSRSDYDEITRLGASTSIVSKKLLHRVLIWALAKAVHHPAASQSEWIGVSAKCWDLLYNSAGINKPLWLLAAAHFALKLDDYISGLPHAGVKGLTVADFFEHAISLQSIADIDHGSFWR